MSIKLMKPEERSSGTENQEEKRGPTSEPGQPPVRFAQPNTPDGKQSTPVMTPVMTNLSAEEISDLLAKLQDILALWPGSDNKVVGSYLLAAFPIPVMATVEKMTKKNGHDKVFSVNGEPVVSLE